MKKGKLQHIKSTKSGFKAPKGYFDTVEDAVFAKLSTKKLPEKEGFSAPDSYFDTVADNILEKIQKEESNQTTSPLDKQTGFKIPENYLESVEDTIISKLGNVKESVKVIDFRSIILKRIIPFAAAASFVLFIILNYNNSEETIFDTVASAEIEQWIENDLIILDTYEIAEVYNDTELENTTIFAEDELLEYLNGTDVESLLLEN